MNNKHRDASRQVKFQINLETLGYALRKGRGNTIIETFMPE